MTFQEIDDNNTSICFCSLDFLFAMMWFEAAGFMSAGKAHHGQQMPSGGAVRPRVPSS